MLFTGVTNNLLRRHYEHTNGLTQGFTKWYQVKRLVYYEETPSIEAAITREKQLKNWHRKWKIALIEKDSPRWDDLSIGLLDSGSSPE